MAENNKIDNMELIEWAFEQGYNLAKNDAEQGVHINFSETQKYFLDELNEFYSQKNKISCIAQ